MPISPSNRPLVLITMGDPAGIGPEIILKSFNKTALGKKISFLIIGDEAFLKKESRRLGIRLPQVSILDMGNVPSRKFKYGIMRPILGKASLEYVRKACNIIMREKRKRRTALVTAPVSKEAINKSCSGFLGHTEYIAKLTGAGFVTMLMASKILKVALVTRHIPLSKVAKVIRKEKIIRTTMQTCKALKTLFKIESPRIGIAALNPHGGEGDIFGKEESEIIKPAVSYLERRIPNIIGPSPADTLFHKAYNRLLDAVICMYHDQGLIPFKMLSFERGVNVTLGLPFIRTSPDHGTAFDIAGDNLANPASMTEAIRLAVLSVGE